MNNFFGPAMTIMGRLRYAQKFGVISLLFVIPFGVLLISLLTELQTKMAFTTDELVGVEFLQPAMQTMTTIQNIRGSSHAASKGLKIFENEHQEAIRQAQNALAQLLQICHNTVERVNVLSHCLTLEADVTSLTSQDKGHTNFSQHTQAIQKLLVILQEVGDQSNLILDPEIKTYYLMDLALNHLPYILENLGQLRGKGSGMAAQGFSSTEDQFWVTQHISGLDGHLESLNRIERIFQKNGHLFDHQFMQSFHQSQNEVQHLLSTLIASVKHQSSQFETPIEFWNRIDNVMNKTTKFSQIVKQALQIELTNRLDTIQRTMWRYLTVSLIMGLLVWYFWHGFYLTVMNMVNNLNQVTRQITTGDVNHETELMESFDELGQVSRDFKLLVKQLKQECATAVEERKRAVKAEEKIQAIVRSTAEGILGINREGIITFTNPRAAHILQHEASELLGLPMHTTIHHSQRNGASIPTKSCSIEKPLQTGISQGGQDEVFWRKDGSWIPIEYTCSPVRNEAGIIQGAVVLFKDISEQQQLEQEKVLLQDQLLRATHEAGKSEIATGILHNVGNVLNSTNISAAAIAEKVGHLEVESLVGIVDLFAEHTGDLQDFLTVDPTGRQIPLFLEEVTKQFSEDQRQLQKEISALLQNLNHIRSIIAAQQKYAKIDALVEETNISDVIQDALEMAITAYGRISIDVEKFLDTEIMVQTNRHKVMEILVNLFHNARHALLDSQCAHPCLTVDMKKVDADLIHIAVRDNGIGIEQEQVSKVFEYGFTTKPEGNGYGLHTAVLAAKALGGSLEVQSDGLGYGATFTLILPSVRKEVRCAEPVLQ